VIISGNGWDHPKKLFPFLLKDCILCAITLKTLFKMYCIYIFQMLQASVVKRQEDGILLVELFESEGPSLNVQLLNMDCVQLDESLQPLFCSKFASAGLKGCGLLQNQRSSNLPISSNQSFELIYQNERQFFIGSIFDVFLMKLEVFGEPMKHCLKCLICLLNRNKN